MNSDYRSVIKVVKIEVKLIRCDKICCLLFVHFFCHYLIAEPDNGKINIIAFTLKESVFCVLVAFNLH